MEDRLKLKEMEERTLSASSTTRSQVNSAVTIEMKSQLEQLGKIVKQAQESSKQAQESITVASSLTDDLQDALQRTQKWANKDAAVAKGKAAQSAEAA